MSACDEEPCKSLIADYWDKTAQGKAAEFMLGLHCDGLKAAERDYWILLSIWLAVFAQALACAAMHLAPWLCAALTVASLALLASLALWWVRILRLRALVRVYGKAAWDLYAEMLSLRRQIAVRCPPECRPEAVRIRWRC